MSSMGDGQSYIHRLRRADARANAGKGRHRIHGQSAYPQIEGAREAIAAVGATIRYLSAYSPDLNSIEMAFSKLKAALLDLSP